MRHLPYQLAVLLVFNRVLDSQPVVVFCPEKKKYLFYCTLSTLLNYADRTMQIKAIA